MLFFHVDPLVLLLLLVDWLSLDLLVVLLLVPPERLHLVEHDSALGAPEQGIAVGVDGAQVALEVVAEARGEVAVHAVELLAAQVVHLAEVSGNNGIYCNRKKVFILSHFTSVR